MKLYLDHNVYIKCLNDKDLKNFVIDECARKKIQILYSPAHIEETYQVEMKKESPYSAKAPELRGIIDEITNSTEILPTMTELIIRHERTRDVYRRVKGIDTRQTVENDSLERFRIDKENYSRMRKEDKHNLSIPVLSPAEIWEHPKIKEQIDHFNANSEYIVRQYNSSPRVVFPLMVLGVDKTLPADLRLSRGNYSTRLKHSFNELEYTIEILMRILNFCGYREEKEAKTAISSTHDTTHCIYATAADVMIAMDKNFAIKSEAVYHFLGVGTQVKFCSNIEELRAAVAEL
ncbi:MAG: hypothetical protein IJR85_02340 [Synergistaceae bacterium]|nr:hypothetical protein [Synergistaceae bacterium]